MQVRVQLFSILRSCLPPESERGRATLSLKDGATLADLITHLQIDQHLGLAPEEIGIQAGWQVMVSDRFEANLERVLQDGDDIKILPPIAGG
jgi:molybdopterin converting factor small subunit